MLLMMRVGVIVRRRRLLMVMMAWGYFYLLAGIALMVSGFAQGAACAAAINAFKSKAEIFGISIAPAAVVEGFAVFAFVFALVLAGSVPGMGG